MKVEWCGALVDVALMHFIKWWGPDKPACPAQLVTKCLMLGRYVCECGLAPNGGAYRKRDRGAIAEQGCVLSVDWAQMLGALRLRYCSQCSSLQNVFLALNLLLPCRPAVEEEQYWRARQQVPVT